jgi:predicted HTH transcriptional regulator
MGNRVHFDGLGYFMMTLSSEAIESSKEIRAESVHFKSISFRPEAGLKKEFKTIRLERAPRKAHSSTLTEEAIIQKLKAYFALYPTLSSREFRALCSLQHTTAATRLKALVKKGVLLKIGQPKFPVYVLAEEVK